MVKKLFFVFVVVIFTFALAMTPPLIAQEEQSEDIEDFSLEELLNVEITTAGKQAEKISEIPASVVLVTRDDIEKYGYQTLPEVLESIPGLYQIDDNFFKSFGVRGFWGVTANRNVIILVNDVKQTDSLSSAHALLGINVPVEAIDRIEVVRGPMSVMYGTGAFFGVINIKTNVVDEKNAINRISASVGSEETYKLFARASGKEGNFQYSMNASYFDTEGLDNKYFDMGNPLILPSLGVTPDMTTGGHLEVSQKYFNFSGSFKNISFDASYTESPKEVFLALPAVVDGNLTKNRAVRVGLGYSKEFSEKAKLNAKLVYYMNRMYFDYDMQYPGFYGVQDNESSGYSAEVNLFLDPSPKLNITLGAEYYKVLDATIMADIPGFSLFNVHWSLLDDESVVRQSIFAQASYKFSEQFRFVVGARVEQVPEYKFSQTLNSGLEDELILLDSYDQTSAEFIPRVALIYSPNENHYFKFLYGEAINRPSFFQTSLELNRPDLEPETIKTFELNYIGSLSPKFSVSLSVFHNMLDKLIFRSLSVVDGVYQSIFDNVGEMTTTGVEASLTAAPNEKFQFVLSGTYQDTKNKREGMEEIDPGYSPKFLGYLKSSYFFNKDISLGVTGSYVGEIYSYYDSTLTPPDRIGEKVDGYFLLGANLRLRNLFGTGLFMNLRGSNLLDTDVRYPATSNSNAYTYFGTFGRGMTFLFTMGWNF